MFRLTTARERVLAQCPSCAIRDLDKVREPFEQRRIRIVTAFSRWRVNCVQYIDIGESTNNQAGLPLEMSSFFWDGFRDTRRFSAMNMQLVCASRHLRDELGRGGM
jgi:hypothetical protein